MSWVPIITPSIWVMAFPSWDDGKNSIFSRPLLLSAASFAILSQAMDAELFGAWMFPSFKTMGAAEARW